MSKEEPFDGYNAPLVGLSSCTMKLGCLSTVTVDFSDFCFKLVEKTGYVDIAKNAQQKCLVLSPKFLPSRFHQNLFLPSRGLKMLQMDLCWTNFRVYEVQF